ncbi:amidohydrolase/deacetylase family metallohydrolase [Virgibacillus halodenitrificans]|uniref:Amidohydrolase/deacetylase family metallohydrolase n=1 Tax=Virgibacillus halodenitrificans TaxID=1482 RepID=A0ABR7VPD5_VIRHA|nr:amidohydrolase/deacetylase family metallohydrolase [Virgibacillus halodenitrificans]MBD1222397.1 amidohydrolase/deacetylase family metallohydrolase [Virgibacillus halodenitrificans]WHX25680.1 amidohydrolase/deacetylase family metallohydrolase [Virgibacillus halodenitrificans]
MLNIHGASLINGKQCNITIKNGYIQDVTKEEVYEGDVISVPEGVYVSPGWIDIHTHAFPKFEPYCAHPDIIGYKSGVTTVVDAGSCGADNIEELYELNLECKTRVFSFLNISNVGLKVLNELADLAAISPRRIYESFHKYPDMLVGLKARMSASVIGENGIKPLHIARSCAEKLNKPVMVHIGSAPPKLQDILKVLAKGDIVTHCFNEKEGNNIFNNDPVLTNLLQEAIKRGVYLDVGHGTSSFSFRTAKKAMQKKIPFQTISTDIYETNRIHGPVYNMATTLNKFLALGYSLEEVIRSVTEKPAQVLNKPQLGSLKKGSVADLTFFKVEKKHAVLTDSLGNTLDASVEIKPYAVLLGGEYIECDNEYELKESN